MSDHAKPARPDAAVIAAALPRRGHEPDLLQRAARAGRVRGIGLDLWARMAASPQAAGGVLRRGMREARALHSRERRFVGDLLHDLPRARDLLRAVLGGVDDATLWDAWLAWQGLDPDAVPEAARAGAALHEHGAAALAGRSPTAAWAAVAGVPEPVAVELLDALGPELGGFLAASAGRAAIGVRVAGAPAERDGLLAELVAAGIEARPGRWSEHALIVPAGTDLGPWERRAPGRFEVQDEASQLVAAALAPARSERVLDACAGAGGKALALAEAGAEVFAADVRARALDELGRRAEAAGLRVHTRLWPEQGPIGRTPFDAVLADLPCSGTGTWRRHPELRWRLDTLDATRATQDAVLDRAADSVAPGGRLVVATCSVLPSEGEARIAALCERRPELSVEPVEGPPELRSGPYLRTWPHRQGVDGFFVARLTKAGRA